MGNKIMSVTPTNETYSIGIMDIEAASKYILGMENEPEKNDVVYRRFLKNLNFTTLRNVSKFNHNFANILFNDNASSSIQNITQHHQLDDGVVPKPLNNKFDVANSEVILIMLTVIYVIIFITGVLGNVVTCIVIARNKGMHTAVNYYLFSLAVSDLLLLISALPDEVYMLWFREYPFDETICKFHKFAAETFATATVLTITAFTIERYVAICKPFLSHTMSKLSRAYKFILVIWTISICLAVPQTLFTLHLNETYLICMPKKEYNHLFVVSTFLLFVIPMSIITILYVLIGLQLRKSKIVQRGAVNGSSVRLKRKIFKKATNQTLVTVNCESHYSDALLQHTSDANKNHFIDHESIIPEDGRINYSNRGPSHCSRHVVNMLVVVVIAFFLCWCPFHIQRIVFTYIEYGAIDENLSFSINTISGVLFFVSTCINPFLYNIMSNKFREAFKVTIASYFARSTDKDNANGKLFRTVSQRSYSCSVNSTSLNTCSSVSSMQPFSQQQTFRYFDSDMAKKRPLVVSFRRIQKMNPTNCENSNSVSICDIHRLDTTFKDNNEVMTMKIMSKSGGNPLRCSLLRKGFCGENLSYRNQSPLNDKQKSSRLDSLYDERTFEASTSDKGCVFPKEKFYGNAQLLLTMTDGALPKAVIDYEHDSHERYLDHNYLRTISSKNRFKKDFAAKKCGFPFKKNSMQTKPSTTITQPDDNKMIDDAERNYKSEAAENNFLSNREKRELHSRENEKLSLEERNESETKSFSKSSSFPISFSVEEYSLKKTEARDEKIGKSVSSLSVNRKL